jgi:hypothetical protein
MTLDVATTAVSHMVLVHHTEWELSSTLCAGNELCWREYVKKRWILAFAAAAAAVAFVTTRLLLGRRRNTRR